MVNTTTPAASKLACDIIRDHLGALAEVRSERRGQRLRGTSDLLCVRSAWVARWCMTDDRRWLS
jgi:hypothetical protein